jgi:SAM-dependent methyltransferase
MSRRDQQRWNAKYAKWAAGTDLSPNQWLIEHIDLLPKGRALDLATGTGHSAIELARRGWQVTAIDVSPAGLRLAQQAAERLGVSVSWIAADLDVYPLPSDHFDVITVFHYLDRDRLPHEIVRALRPGGMLVYETYTLEELRLPNAHLTNPAHALRPGELLSLFSALRARRYRDVVLTDRAVASLVAEKVSGEW